MVPFPEWCKNIEHLLQAVQLLKSEEPAQLYCLLPSIWHGMNLAEKIQMVAMINAHGGEVSVDICKALFSEWIILLKDQKPMFVAYEIYKMHPEHMLLSALKKSADTSWSEGRMAKV